MADKTIQCRLLRIELEDGNVEILCTSLTDIKKYKHSEFKALYHYRWNEEEILPNEYFFLYKRFQILGDFWISSAEVATHNLSKKMVLEYVDILNQAIYPYLTNKGKKEYCKLIGC